MSRGRPPKVDHIREDFLGQITVAKNLETAVRPLMSIHRGNPSLHPKHVYRTIELAFMGVCAAWEDFLEATMVRYLAGAQTSSGFKPTLRVGHCENLQHAYEVVSGKPEYDPEEHFMSWTNPIAVTKLAKVYFSGGAPFDAPLRRENNRLKQAVRVRNRVAHASEKCKVEYREAANNIRGRTASTRLGKGHRVGELLSETAGVFFGAAVPASNITVFDAYMNVYTNLAKNIVP